MPALKPGVVAPDFELKNLDGSNFHLADALESGPVLLVFLKVNCPVCQFGLPILDRIYSSYGGRHIQVIGISQNDEQKTRQFVQQYNISFPVLLDPAPQYRVSNSYGLTNVPTTYWIDAEQQILRTTVGFARAEYESLAREFAERQHSPAPPLFANNPDVPAFRPG